MATIGFVLTCYLLADLLAGFWHWLEDRYFDESWPIVGKYIAKPNQLHHDQPQAFLEQGYWSRNWTTLLPAGIAFALTAPSPWSLVFLFVSQANEIHAWAHSKGKVSRCIEAIQDTGLFQSPRHHALHHRSPFGDKYCMMSDWLNPFLDGINFWRTIEWIIATTLRIHPKSE